MFISLTASDNGQAVDVRADQVQAVQVLDAANTLIVLVGGGELDVRESPHRVKEAIATVLGWAVPGPRAVAYEGGKW